MNWSSFWIQPLTNKAKVGKETYGITFKVFSRLAKVQSIPTDFGVFLWKIWTRFFTFTMYLYKYVTCNNLTSRSNLGYSSATTTEVAGKGTPQGGTAEGVGTGASQRGTAEGVGSRELPTSRGTPAICPTLFDSWPIVSFAAWSGDIGFAGFIKASIGSGSDVAVLCRMGMVGTEAFPAAMLGLEPVLGIRDILMRIRIPGSVPLTNGSGPGSGSDYFLQWL